ncbi:hypothetical protein BJV74DRAFT_828248, partial [Russula compacta]
TVIIVLHEMHLDEALPDENPHTSLTNLCQKPKVNALVLKECNAAGKKSVSKGIVPMADEWTPESGSVTAAQKIQRKKTTRKFDAEVQEVFKRK